MKRSKAGLITAALTAFVMLTVHSPRVRAESYCDTLSYIVCGDSAVITGCENSPEVLDIPGRIEGHTVSAIRENAFYKCGSLKSLTIPDTVTSIGHHAFSGCAELGSAEIKGKVTAIEDGCFLGCSSLHSVSLPDTVKKIGRNAFYKCSALKGIILPKGLEQIGENSFCGCDHLEDIRLPDRIIKVGDRAFFGCIRLLEVNIPDSAAELGSCAFGYSEGSCRKVSDLTLTGSSVSLGKAYAEDNGFGYAATDSERTIPLPTVPIAIVIFSGTGLLFLFIPGKLRYFRARYEYEG